MSKALAEGVVELRESRSETGKEEGERKMGEGRREGVGYTFAWLPRVGLGWQRQITMAKILSILYWNTF